MGLSWTQGPGDLTTIWFVHVLWTSANLFIHTNIDSNYWGYCHMKKQYYLTFSESRWNHKYQFKRNFVQFIKKGLWGDWKNQPAKGQNVRFCLVLPLDFCLWLFLWSKSRSIPGFKLVWALSLALDAVHEVMIPWVSREAWDSLDGEAEPWPPLDLHILEDLFSPGRWQVYQVFWTTKK